MITPWATEPGSAFNNATILNIQKPPVNEINRDFKPHLNDSITKIRRRRNKKRKIFKNYGIKQKDVSDTPFCRFTFLDTSENPVSLFLF